MSELISGYSGDSSRAYTKQNTSKIRRLIITDFNSIQSLSAPRIFVAVDNFLSFVLAFFLELSEEDKRELLTEEIIDFPEEAMEALSACMKAFPPVKKAYFINLFDPSAEEQAFPLIGLETEPLEREKAQLLVSAVFQMVNQAVEVHPQLEIAILDENLPMTDSIVKNSQPFYVRDSIEHLEYLFH